MGSGDIIAQTFLEGKNIREVNWKRTVPYASIGLFVVSSLNILWYTLLKLFEPNLYCCCVNFIRWSTCYYFNIHTVSQ